MEQFAKKFPGSRAYVQVDEPGTCFLAARRSAQSAAAGHLSAERISAAAGRLSAQYAGQAETLATVFAKAVFAKAAGQVSQSADQLTARLQQLQHDDQVQAEIESELQSAGIVAATLDTEAAIAVEDVRDKIAQLNVSQASLARVRAKCDMAAGIVQTEVQKHLLSPPPFAESLQLTEAIIAGGHKALDDLAEQISTKSADLFSSSPSWQAGENQVDSRDGGHTWRRGRRGKNKASASSPDGDAGAGSQRPQICVPRRFHGLGPSLPSSGNVWAAVARAQSEGNASLDLPSLNRPPVLPLAKRLPEGTANKYAKIASDLQQQFYSCSQASSAYTQAREDGN